MKSLRIASPCKQRKRSTTELRSPHQSNPQGVGTSSGRPRRKEYQAQRPLVRCWRESQRPPRADDQSSDESRAAPRGDPQVQNETQGCPGHGAHRWSAPRRTAAPCIGTARGAPHRYGAASHSRGRDCGEDTAHGRLDGGSSAAHGGSLCQALRCTIPQRVAPR